MGCGAVVLTYVSSKGSILQFCQAFLQISTKKKKQLFIRKTDERRKEQSSQNTHGVPRFPPRRQMRRGTEVFPGPAPLARKP